MSFSTQIIDFLKANLKAYSPDQHVVTVVPSAAAGRYEVHYHTVYHNDFLSIFTCLSQAEIAPLLSKVVISSEDHGVNGTQYWDLKELLKGPGIFESLEEFTLPMNGNHNHNRIIATYRDSYDENGGLGLLLDKCPCLLRLSAPSAPNAAFFSRAAHPLQELHIQTGYDHQDFLQHLSQSTCFPDLATLVFREYAETYMDDFKAQCTPFAAYEALMRAEGLPAMKSVVLYDTLLDAAQKTALEGLAKVRGRVLEFRAL